MSYHIYLPEAYHADPEAHFPVLYWLPSTNRTERLIEGFSMGGYGAARIGLKHSDLFQALSLFGAGPLQLDFMTTDHTLVPLETREQIFNQVYGADTNYFIAQSPWTLAATYAESDTDDLIIRQAIGAEDLLLPHNRAFHERLTDLNIPHHYTEVDNVGHQPLLLLLGLGPDHWLFYRDVLGPP